MPARSGPKGFKQGSSRPTPGKGIPENFTKGGKSGNKSGSMRSGSVKSSKK